MTTEKKPLATAIIRFNADRSIDVKLSGCGGVTARMVDAVPSVLWKEIQALRAKDRIEDTKRRLEEQKRQEAEEAKRRNTEVTHAT